MNFDGKPLMKLKEQEWLKKREAERIKAEPEGQEEDNRRKGTDERDVGGSIGRMLKSREERSKVKNEATEKAVDKLVKKIFRDSRGERRRIIKNVIGSDNFMEKPKAGPKIEDASKTQPPVKQEKGIEKKKGLVSLTLWDGSTIELNDGDDFYFENIKYKITGTRTAKKNGAFLIKAKSEESEKATEITPKEFEKKFNVGMITVPEATERQEKDMQVQLGKIAERIKQGLERGERISQIVIHAQENYEPKEGERGLTFKSDLDELVSLYILQNLSTKELLNDDTVFSIIPKGGSEENLKNENKFPYGIKTMERERTPGMRVMLDVSGNWPKLSDDGNTAFVDHHGKGRRNPTSSAEMSYEILKKGNLLKETPEWLPGVLKLVNGVDNLTYLDNKENGEKVFNEEYFKNIWPNSLFALADQKDIQVKEIFELCKNGTIKDPTKPLTEEELNGKIGNQKIKKRVKNPDTDKMELREFTIKELCTEIKGNVEKTLEGIENANEYARETKLNLETELLGKIVYHNAPIKESFTIKHGKNAGKLIEKNNYIEYNLAYKAIKATGVDTFISWNKEGKKFFINSSNSNVSEIVEMLNKADPGCAVDVRGTMVFGTIKNLTEQQFLNIIDRNILKNVRTRGGEIEQKRILKPKRKEKEEKDSKAPAITKEPEENKLEKTKNNIEIQIEEILKGLIPKGIEHLDGFIKFCEKMKMEAKTQPVIDFFAVGIIKTIEAKKLLKEQEKLKIKSEMAGTAPETKEPEQPIATIDTIVTTPKEPATIISTAEEKNQPSDLENAKNELKKWEEEYGPWSAGIDAMHILNEKQKWSEGTATLISDREMEQAKKEGFVAPENFLRGLKRIEERSPETITENDLQMLGQVYREIMKINKEKAEQYLLLKEKVGKLEGK